MIDENIQKRLEVLEANVKLQFFHRMQVFRNDRDILLYDMDKKLGYTSSELSGYEHLREPLPKDFFHKVKKNFEVSKAEIKGLRKAYEDSHIETHIKKVCQKH